MFKYIFRGYDNPRVEGFPLYYGDGSFTLGKEYQIIGEIHWEGCEDEEAVFIDDNGDSMCEELMFFDKVKGE